MQYCGSLLIGYNDARYRIFTYEFKFSIQKIYQSLAVIKDQRHFYNYTDKNCSFINKKFFREIENNKDMWNGNLKLPIFHFTILHLKTYK